MTTVSQVMTRGPRSLSPADTVLHAAQAMAELNVGAIPVCDGGKLVGMVTDRDIVLRAVARSRDGQTTRLSDVMSGNVRSATEDQDIEQVLATMAAAQIRRMPVVDGKAKLVGIISLGDIAVKDLGDDLDLAASLGTISSPTQPERSAGPHGKA